jgi:tetratricopeptide (TPR) repeat protein
MFNVQRSIFIICGHPTLTDEQSSRYFLYLDSLNAAINSTKDTDRAVATLFMKAVASTAIQDNQQAIDDLTTFLQIDSTSVLALWQRAVCQARISKFNASEGANTDLSTASVLADLNHALALRPQNPYLLYNRACIHALRQNYRQAIDDFTAALAIEPNLAEAYYNRGICHLNSGDQEAAKTDLSKAGELGLYNAYSVLKRQNL